MSTDSKRRRLITTYNKALDAMQRSDLFELFVVMALRMPDVWAHAYWRFPKAGPTPIECYVTI